MPTVPPPEPSRQGGRSATAFALLGLLSLRPWTTYELARQVRRSLNWFWPRAERQLYDEPKRLVAGGLATAAKEHTGMRPRTVYKITPLGRHALKRWLDEPAAARTSEFEAMLKVFFADAGSLAQLVTTLSAIQHEATDRLAELAVLTGQALAADAPFPKRLHLGALTVRLHVEQEEAIARWAGWALDQVSGWKAADDPGAWDYQGVLRDLATRASG